MASRRKLKKEIKYVVSELLHECFICHCVIPGFDATKLDTLVGRIIEINSDISKKINNPEGTKNRARTKAYYKNIVNDFNTAVDGIVKELN